MKKLFTIGEMAKLNYVSAHTLRYYDKIGFLRPSYVDEKTGYRYYDYEQFLFLDTVQYLKSFNMSLDEIKAQFENRTAAETLYAYRDQEQEITKEIEALKSVQARIRHNIENLKALVNSEFSYSPEMVHYDDRYIIAIEENVSDDTEYEVKIRPLSHKLYNSYFRFMDDFISIRDIEDVKNGIYNTTAAIGSLLKEIPTKANYTKLDEGDYACLYHKGDWEYVESDYLRLLDYIKKQGMEPAGNAIEIYLIDLVDTRLPNEYLGRIEIPVK